MKEYDHAQYLEKFIRVDLLAERVRLAVRALKGREFDAIAYCGNSGALIAIPVALKLKKPLILVRKEGEKCHSSRYVEGFIGAKKYVILDDFVSSGKTAKHIVTMIDKRMPHHAECLGVLEVDYLGDNIFKRKTPKELSTHWMKGGNDD